MKHNPKILIIEDDMNNHPLFKDVFENSGFEVELFQSADGDLVQKVIEVNPSIISMDLMMGKDGAALQRDGFQAIEVLKADDRTKGIPIIVLTNFFKEEKVRKAKEVGAVDFINTQGQGVQTIPRYYLQYLYDPKHYKPLHPIFNEE